MKIFKYKKPVLTFAFLIKNTASFFFFFNHLNSSNLLSVTLPSENWKILETAAAKMPAKV